MATISYGQLQEPGFVLNLGDRITIHGDEYDVRHSEITDKYFLENFAVGNDAVFSKLNLEREKYELAREYEKEVEDCGSFPEFKKLLNLTAFAIRLITMPLYKIGDKVMIAEYKKGENYPFGFNDGMQKYSGAIATIEYIDGGIRKHAYHFKEFGFVWSENQFKLVPKKCIEFLKVGDTVVVGNTKCIVESNESGDAYWIARNDGPEREIYDNLGITNKQKEALAKKYNATSLIPASPEFEYLEELTDFVNALNSGEWKCDDIKADDEAVLDSQEHIKYEQIFPKVVKAMPLVVPNPDCLDSEIRLPKIKVNTQIIL